MIWLLHHNKRVILNHINQKVNIMNENENENENELFFER